MEINESFTYDKYVGLKSKLNYWMGRVNKTGNQPQFLFLFPIQVQSLFALFYSIHTPYIVIYDSKLVILQFTAS